MPSLATMEAATPKCPNGDRANVPGPVCGKPMLWITLDNGRDWWCCPVHGPLLTGDDAALRAGYVPYVAVEPTA